MDISDSNVSDSDDSSVPPPPPLSRSSHPGRASPTSSVSSSPSSSDGDAAVDPEDDDAWQTQVVYQIRITSRLAARVNDKMVMERFGPLGATQAALSAHGEWLVSFLDREKRNEAVQRLNHTPALGVRLALVPEQRTPRVLSRKEAERRTLRCALVEKLTADVARSTLAQVRIEHVDKLLASVVDRWLAKQTEVCCCCCCCHKSLCVIIAIFLSYLSIYPCIIYYMTLIHKQHVSFKCLNKSLPVYLVFSYLF